MLPCPDAPWYDPTLGQTGEWWDDLMAMSPGQRRSLARYLLGVRKWDYRFSSLLDADPEAFSPWADALMALEPDEIAAFAQTYPKTYWLAARGASSQAVSILATALSGSLGRSKLDPTTLARIALLIGADTDDALAVLGDVARANRQVAVACAEHNLEVPDAGPLVRRFRPDALEIVAGGPRQAAGAAVGPPNVPEGWSCRAPLHMGFSADLVGWFARQQDQEASTHHHWLWSSCEACEEWMNGYVFEQKEEVQLKGVLDARGNRGTERPARHPCKGQPARLAAGRPLRIEPFNPDRLPGDGVGAGRLGGRPRWTQAPVAPACPRCGRLAFFIGQLNAGRASGASDTDYFSFRCEACQLALQVAQFT